MINAVGVVGAGTIGTGVAHAFAEAGYPVVLVDTSEEALKTARETIAGNARLLPVVVGRAPTRTAEEILALITPSTELGDLRDVGYVVENVTEKWDVKKDLYRDLDRVCAPECVLAVNTSAIPITRLAGRTSRPDKVIGNHFMNPVPVMPLVEIIRGFHTSEATLEASRRLLADIGKDTILVGDSSGFVTNRVLMLTINEAIFLLHEQVSSPTDIDRLFKKCFGHRMGPMETADLIGLDTVLYSLEVLLDEFKDPKYRPCPLLRRYVDAGLLGRKTGRGFHVYDHD
ncbi:3-hydroxyacyl-CoA dehydrogenase family protein [Actinomadura luteofluorescens]|uniref:3-hydroxyacyl-CoA dehydrogenase family protein n=1 Tax=Actinomadura luteofluorescens TaxID=46163 RepID=UPI0021644613|nr:3-hydroxyacyl-CoA dehydrogenase NAD-binding domain-containing protein [Actinomadura glauciflava]MCR3740339.1 3-hydroxyacyl-CoA dehydrogenase (EC 1.1.1.35) [Actinomadura glauciflava]